MRPMKFRFVVATARSPAARMPRCPPRQGPHDDGPTAHPARMKGLDEAFLDRLEIDRVAARQDDAAHVLCDLPPLEHLRCPPQVLEPPVGARADDDLVDRNVADLADRPGVLRQMRKRDHRLERRAVDLVDLGVLSVGIAQDHLIRTPRPLVDPRQRRRIWLHDATLAAGLDRHVAHGEPVGHAEAFDDRPGELHRLVPRPVDADEADRVEDEVLPGHPLAQRPGVHELQRLRHAEPALAGRHGRRGVGRSHARREGAKAAVGAGVRVRADDDLARQDDALLRQDDVLDAGVADLVVVDDALLLGEVAHELDLRRGGDVLGRRVVVGHERHTLRVEDRRGTHFAQHLDGYRRRDVIGENQVELAVDKSPGLTASLPAARASSFSVMVICVPRFAAPTCSRRVVGL